MARRTQVLPSEPPTLTPQRAIELIRRQLDKYLEIVKLHRHDPEVQKWESTTEGILNAAFGKPNGREYRDRRLVSDFFMPSSPQCILASLIHQPSLPLGISAHGG
jgi:hypothetical protein